MRRSLVAIVFAVALLGLVLPTGYAPDGRVAAAAGKRDGCPAKLGPLRSSSSRIGEESANFGEVKCIYADKDFVNKAIIRVSWLMKTASPAALSDSLDTCLRSDEDHVGFGQHGDDTRTGFTFPRSGERYILGGYIATQEGPSVEQIKKITKKVVSAYAELAASCPGSEQASDETLDAADDQEGASIDDCFPSTDDGTANDVGSAVTAFLSADTGSGRTAQAGPRCPADIIGVGLLVRDIFDEMGVSLADPAREPEFDRAYHERCFGRTDRWVDLLEEGDAETKLAAELTCLLLGDRTAETNNEVPLLVWALMARAIEQQQSGPAASE